MSFRLVPKSVTVNDLERRNGRYFDLRYFSEFGYFRGALRKSSRSLSHLLMSSCIVIPPYGSMWGYLVYCVFFVFVLFFCTVYYRFPSGGKR